MSITETWRPPIRNTMNNTYAFQTRFDNHKISVPIISKPTIGELYLIDPTNLSKMPNSKPTQALNTSWQMFTTNELSTEWICKVPAQALLLYKIRRHAATSLTIPRIRMICHLKFFFLYKTKTLTLETSFGHTVGNPVIPINLSGILTKYS